MREKYSLIEKYIDKSKIKYNEPMSKHTTIKVGGKADVLVTPDSIEDIKNVLKIAKDNDIKVYVIGNGSKLLVKDGGIRGIVIKLSSRFSNCSINGNCITVEAGASLPKLAIVAKENSLSGLEFAAGIPGNIGGAIYMNAGAYGSDMSNVVMEVTYLDQDLNVKSINGKDCEFGYTTSIFKTTYNECIILSVKLKLEKKDKKEIEQAMKKNNDSRREKQPLEYPNAGSTFKRPEGYFVGKLIDDLGLKGMRLGGAEVSLKHSGFIVNTGNAKAKDVINLIEYIKKEVLKNNNVKLEEEIIIIGEEENK